MSESQPTVQYRDIPGFPGYRVGDDGSVWSCRPRNGHGPLTSTWRQMKPTPQRRGYLLACLYRDGKDFYRQVHRLVLLAFVGPCPSGMQGCHFPDQNPANNNLSNLRWDTPKANQADCDKHGTRWHGEKVTNSKLTAAKVLTIRSEYRRGHRSRPGNCAELAKRYGVSQVLICLIVRRKTWKHF